MLRRFLSRQAPGAEARAVAEGRAHELTLDLEDGGEEAAELLSMLRSVPVGSISARRLRNAITVDGRDAIVDALIATPSATRELATQLCGRLHLEEAVPWLEVRLLDRNRRVRHAAARALGRIGGVRSAEALLRADGRARIPRSRLCIELAKAAPRLFLEQAVADPDWAAQRPEIIIALGLRRHGRVSVATLLAEVPVGSAAELLALCHVIAKLGDRSAVPWLFGLLDHDDRAVRAAADHALQRIHRTAFGRPLARPLQLVGAGG